MWDPWVAKRVVATTAYLASNHAYGQAADESRGPRDGGVGTVWPCEARARVPGGGFNRERLPGVCRLGH